METTISQRLPRFNYYQGKSFSNTNCNGHHRNTQITDENKLGEKPLKLSYYSGFLLQKDASFNHTQTLDRSRNQDQKCLEEDKFHTLNMLQEENKKNSSYDKNSTDSPKSSSHSSGIFSVMISSGENTSDEMHLKGTPSNSAETKTLNDPIDLNLDQNILNSMKNVDNLFWNIQEKFINLKQDTVRIEHDLNYSSNMIRDISKKQKIIFDLVRREPSSCDSPLQFNDESAVTSSNSHTSNQSCRVTSIRRLKQFHPHSDNMKFQRFPIGISPKTKSLSQSASRLSVKQSEVDDIKRKRNPFNGLISRCRKSLENITQSSRASSEGMHRSHDYTMMASSGNINELSRIIPVEKSIYHDDTGHIITTSTTKLEVIRSNFKRSVSDFFHNSSSRRNSTAFQH